MLTLAAAPLGDWLTMGFLLAAGLLAFRALQAARAGAVLARRYPHPERRAACRSRSYRIGALFWWMTILVCTAAAVAPHVSILGWLSDLGRGVAKAQGWYAARRDYQVEIAATIGLVGVALLAAGLAVTRPHLPRHLPAFLGGLALLGTLVLRTASMHDVDALLAHRFAGLTVTRWIDVGAGAMIAACALANAWWYVRPGPPVGEVAHEST